MNRNLVLGMSLAILVILACSFTSGGPTGPAEVPPTTVPNKVEPTTPSQDQMATFVAQTVEAQQPLATETPIPPAATPTLAAPVLPKAPGNFSVDATCTKIVAHSYTVYKYVFVAYMHWDAVSSVTGFEINKDGDLLTTMESNATEYKDTFTITTPYKRYNAEVTYTIQAVNEAGKSEAAEVYVTVTCR